MCQVDAAEPWTTVWAEYKAWLVSHGFLSASPPTFAFVTCGDWDLKTMLPAQAAYSGTDIPTCFRSWVNAKVVYNNAHRGFTARGMTDMLSHAGLALEGRHHSGIDDTRNIARVMMKLMADGLGSYVRATWKAK